MERVQGQGRLGRVQNTAVEKGRMASRVCILGAVDTGLCPACALWTRCICTQPLWIPRYGGALLKLMLLRCIAFKCSHGYPNELTPPPPPPPRVLEHQGFLLSIKSSRVKCACACACTSACTCPVLSDQIYPISTFTSPLPAYSLRFDILTFPD